MLIGIKDIYDTTEYIKAQEVVSVGPTNKNKQNYQGLGDFSFIIMLKNGNKISFFFATKEISERKKKEFANKVNESIKNESRWDESI